MRKLLRLEKEWPQKSMMRNVKDHPGLELINLVPIRNSKKLIDNWVAYSEELCFIIGEKFNLPAKQKYILRVLFKFPDTF
jgi:hypothetical protein